MIYIDANNHVRRLLESPQLGSMPRNLLNEYIDTPESVAFVWDGGNSLKSRREIYPDYKAKREKPKEDIYIGFEVIREVLKNCPVIQIRVPNFEADDVIAACVSSGDTIVSTDRDFLQIEDVTCTSTPYPNIPRSQIRLYKATVGDPSDNIPGIKGFGQKAWDGIDKTSLRNWIDNPDHPVDWPPRCVPDWEQVRVYWQIVGFLPVPEADIRAGITIGKKNYLVADLFLKELMQ